MKRILVALFFIFSFHVSNAQGAKNYVVLLSADVQASPPRITLKWNYHSAANQYQVFRKLKNGSTWGTALVTLSANDTTYIDNNVGLNTSYEYLVVKTTSSYNGFGFINSSIELEPEANKPKVMVLIDSNIYDSLISEISQWIIDAENEGWQTASIIVPRSLSAEGVKAKLITEYQKDPANTKTLFIIGHVPVPYSGNFKPTPPDGHTEHVVAWPADVYYGDIDGLWSDNLVDDTSGARDRHWNILGDGKWDQTILGNNNTVDIEVGRVDFYDMPAFSQSEVQLLREYLNKCHNYKIGSLKPKRRGLIDDNFGAFSGEAFAASGWSNLSSLIGRDNILLCDATNGADYINTMDTASYLWSYGCGAGGYSSCSGIGNTNNLASKNIQTVFTMLFGSYFGDWDSKNNFLRAALASGTTLTNVWSGRPRWFFHHMGLGEHIGYSAMLTQNNPSTGNLYNGSAFPNGIHIALLGDPTLKMHYVIPPSNLSTVLVNNMHVSLNWTRTSETILGYNIYKKRIGETSYSKINSSIVSGTSYIDSCISSPDSFVFQVRAVKLETTASGSYYNESLGITDTFNNDMDLNPKADFNIVDNDPSFEFDNTSVNANMNVWTFSDTTMSNMSLNSSRTYSSNGNYWVLLTTSNECLSDTQKMNIVVSRVPDTSTNSIRTLKKSQISIFPNPFNNRINIETELVGDLCIRTQEGKLIQELVIENNKVSLSLEYLSQGVYILEFIDKEGRIEVFQLLKGE